MLDLPQLLHVMPQAELRVAPRGMVPCGREALALRAHENGLAQLPTACLCPPDSAVVLEEGNQGRAHMPTGPPELEDFEAVLGADRSCPYPVTYSRVSSAGSSGHRAERVWLHFKPLGSVITSL